MANHKTMILEAILNPALDFFSRHGI